MPRPRWWSLAEDRRERIREAVLDEVADVGLAEASVNRILKAAGFSKGVLYYYFEDRGELLETVMGGIAARLEPHLIAEILGSTTPEEFWSAIHDRYARSVSWLVAHPRMHRVVRWATHGVSGPQQLTPRLQAFPDRVGGLTSRVLEHGRTIGAVRTDLSPDDLFDMALGLMFTMDTMTLRDESPDPAASADRLVDAARRLLSP